MKITTLPTVAYTSLLLIFEQEMYSHYLCTQICVMSQQLSRSSLPLSWVQLLRH